MVQPAILPCRANSTFETESLDGTAYAKDQLYEISTDKFFLLSRPETFGDWDSASLKDGTQLDYYVGLTATERIKRDAAGTEQRTWLRSPDQRIAGNARSVFTDGTVYGKSAYYGHAVTPACIIA